MRTSELAESGASAGWPAGTLAVLRGDADAADPAGEPARVTVIPNGPYVVSGGGPRSRTTWAARCPTTR